MVSFAKHLPQSDDGQRHEREGRQMATIQKIHHGCVAIVRRYVGDVSVRRPALRMLRNIQHDSNRRGAVLHFQWRPSALPEKIVRVSECLAAGENWSISFRFDLATQRNSMWATVRRTIGRRSVHFRRQTMRKINAVIHDRPWARAVAWACSSHSMRTSMSTTARPPAATASNCSCTVPSSRPKSHTLAWHCQSASKHKCRSRRLFRRLRIAFDACRPPCDNACSKTKTIYRISGELNRMRHRIASNMLIKCLFRRTYTRRNCEMECEAKIYDRNCNCILYYLPLIRDDVTICGAIEQRCVDNVTRLIESKTNSHFMCYCLPSCYAISYDADLSATPILTQASHSHVQFKSDVLRSNDVKDLAILHVYFQDSHFRSQIKEELIGFTEFLCECGPRVSAFKIHECSACICSEYGWTVGAVHGLQCRQHHWAAVLRSVSTVLCCPTHRQRRPILPQRRIRSHAIGTKEIPDAVVVRLVQTVRRQSARRHCVHCARQRQPSILSVHRLMRVCDQFGNDSILFAFISSTCVNSACYQK